MRDFLLIWKFVVHSAHKKAAKDFNLLIATMYRVVAPR